MNAPGTRILGIDYGRRRVGAAISDPSGTIASPLEVYERRSPARDAQHYRALVEEERVGRIVVGLPLHTSGRPSELTAEARAFGAWLAAETGRPVAFFDERYTTVEAETILRERGLKAQKRQALRDQIAAQILLRAYLEAGSPESEAPPAPLADEEDVPR